MEEKYVKVLIYPQVRWLTPKEKNRIPTNKVPQVFSFDGETVHVMRMEVCERSVSRKVGGRGFRFVCRVRWASEDSPKTKPSIIWYDDFYDEWFVEVPENLAIRRGIEYQAFENTAERDGDETA